MLAQLFASLLAWLRPTLRPVPRQSLGCDALLYVRRSTIHASTIHYTFHHTLFSF